MYASHQYRQTAANVLWHLSAMVNLTLNRHRRLPFAFALCAHRRYYWQALCTDSSVAQVPGIDDEETSDRIEHAFGQRFASDSIVCLYMMCVMCLCVANLSICMYWLCLPRSLRLPCVCICVYVWGCLMRLYVSYEQKWKMPVTWTQRERERVRELAQDTITYKRQWTHQRHPNIAAVVVCPHRWRRANAHTCKW